MSSPDPEDNKKQKIKTAMLTLIAERGLHNTPMSQVTKHAKVSAGAIYHHFDSKKALITELYLDMKQDFAAITTNGDSPNATYKSRFIAVWHQLYQLLTNDPLKMSFIEQCTTSPLISDETRQKGEGYMMHLIDFFQDGIEQGHLKQMPVILIGSLMYSSVSGTAKLDLTGCMPITSELIALSAECFWDGIKAS